MAGIINGLALSKVIIPFGATFLIFSDYMRGALRLSALMGLQVIYVLTHDSIGQGEDGATHQPIEHLASLRAMPGLTVIRPSDATETTEAWRQALLASDGPTALILTRQKLPILDRTSLAPAANLCKGAYIIRDSDDTPELLLIASGSEVPLVLEAAALLEKEGVPSRVISMPSHELFEQQSQQYKSTVFPRHLTKRLVVEAASSFGWNKYAGDQGVILGIDTYGASAPGTVMMEKFGFTPGNVVTQALLLLGKSAGASL